MWSTGLAIHLLLSHGCPKVVSCKERGIGTGIHILFSPVDVHLLWWLSCLVIGHLGEDSCNDNKGNGPTRNVDSGISIVLIWVIPIGYIPGSIITGGWGHWICAGTWSLITAPVLIELLRTLVATKAVITGATAVAEILLTVVAFKLLVPLPTDIIVAHACLIRWA